MDYIIDVDTPDGAQMFLEDYNENLLHGQKLEYEGLTEDEKVILAQRLFQEFAHDVGVAGFLRDRDLLI